MKRIKSILTALLLIAVVFSATSCFRLDRIFPVLPSPETTVGKNTTDTVEQSLDDTTQFEKLADEYFVEMLTSDTLSMHFYLRHPENYGITDYEATWGDLSTVMTDEAIQEERQSIEEFNAIDRSALTAQQQETYDIIAYYNELFEESLKLNYYSEMLQGDGDFYTLPVLFAEFEFYNERDVTDYLELLEHYQDFTEALAQYEREKSDAGLFMSDRAADGVIEKLTDSISDKESHILLTTFADKIQAMTDIDETKKDEYLTRNQAAFNNNIVPAYEQLTADIEALKGTGTNLGGLSLFPKGKDYCAYSLKRMGAGLSPEEYIDALDEALAEKMTELFQLIIKNPSLLEDIEEDILPELTPTEIIEFWKSESAADFPTLPSTVSYSVKTVKEELQDMLPPAFYLTPQLDNYTTNTIYFNEQYNTDYHTLFFTLAHEGYPGHLLEQVTLLTTDLHELRKTASFLAYTEGWAQYAANYVYKYIDAEEYVQQFYQINDIFNLLLSARVDIGVNYESWDQEDIKQYLNDNAPGLGLDDSDIVNELYEYSIDNPLQTAPYMLGILEVQSLRDYFQDKLGDEYSDMRFHEEYLKRGAAPFPLIKEWIDASWNPLESDSGDTGALLAIVA